MHRLTAIREIADDIPSYFSTRAHPTLDATRCDTVLKAFNVSANVKARSIAKYCKIFRGRVMWRGSGEKRGGSFRLSSDEIPQMSCAFVTLRRSNVSRKKWKLPKDTVSNFENNDLIKKTIKISTRVCSFIIIYVAFLIRYEITVCSQKYFSLERG